MSIRYRRVILILSTIEDDAYADRFQNPDAFLNQFGGYESENSEDQQDEEEEEVDDFQGMIKRMIPAWQLIG
jgi:hypothetical protein